MGVRVPTESQFETAVTDGGVRVTFNPTSSIYTFYKLADPEDIRRYGPVSLANVRHAGRVGDTGDYASDEVQAVAHRLATQAIAAKQ
jgi:hypothetical protein